MKTPQKRRVSLAKSKLQSNTTFRMNILFFAIFLLFSMLILRLGYLQIVKGEDYARAIARTEEVAVNTSVPRGRIFDSAGRLQVDNEPVNSITYTKMQTTKSSEMMEVAEELAKLIEKDTEKVTLRDKQDFYIQLNTESATEKVTAEERAAIEAEDIPQKEKQQKLDALVREKITDEELDSLTEEQLEVLAIYREMTSGYALSPQIIKGEGVTDEEFAVVSERLTDPKLEGVNTVTDWKRVKMTDLTILGSTTSPDQGIPANRLDYYLSRDYSRNDRVGTSFLEQQYEDVLQGQKSSVKNVTDGRGRVIETVPVDEGEPGKDLVMTIDSELQYELEKIVEEKLLALKAGPNSQLVKDAYLVMMNPQTGDVLSMVGKRVGEDENGRRVVNDYAFGTFTAAHEMGSTIKGATLLTGYEQDAVEMGEVQIDEPLKFAGTTQKNSIFNTTPFNRIPMNDLMAIERSSNVYMFKIALDIADRQYQYNRPLSVAPESFAVMRNSFAQFGLGVETGIDLPNEGTGYLGGTYPGPKLLDLAIGQFDTYTPMQLAQYISTIANDGYRVQPHVVKEIRKASPDGETLGPIETVIEPKIMNRINNTQEEIDRVKEGMRNVYIGSSGSARAQFSDTPYTAAGKTGTAEAYFFERGHELHGTVNVNIAHVGFAPYENPEIAYAVVIPYVTTDPTKVPKTNNEIARAAADKYFELKEQRSEDEANEIKPPFSGTRIE
ncbi:MULTISPECIES: penicillin-binding transpeptidase domain-containing protein [unclassified Planococcus (in: firmicutes)]|uniref:penicillin-binding transpeptidase domain-containing protein n=1 Tax=Planococcus TaxID=1372 RepID=UPI000C7B1E86|nr:MULTISPECIES: penicillin-binding transpeptidase domain-containing protein [unclassified Planococcus (in: firmicutes)]PKG45753.1 penicillin-binding protein [Planococcus sp. Urea-trap-24]PKG88538.1 penicillin-binding protein [Planococcus sp. Urea-3u-39]PKH38744.1 penicillin-binding protein [Planococcus sp. MB-3u-09]